jgi:glycosyltransferase involved in cell wall biosynthesis
MPPRSFAALRMTSVLPARERLSVEMATFMNRKPRLLFLAYYFPPLVTVACVRTWNVAMGLAKLGWEVTVVTPDPALWRLTEGETRVTEQLELAGVRRILTGHRWRFLSNEYLKCNNRGLARLAGGACRIAARRFDISPAVGWNTAAMEACAGLQPGEVDVILATGSPFNSFEIAHRLGRRLAAPFVLDYRDGWTVGNPYPPRPGFPMKRTQRSEQRVLADCAATMIVSPSNAKLLAEAFGVGDKLHVVTNGYDPELMRQVVPHDFGHFAIAYTGHFHPPWRVVDPLMAALARLPADSPSWRFHYYGRENSYVREVAERNQVLANVVLHGNRPQSEVLAAVKGAGVSVVITTVSETCSMADRGIVTGKVFEAIGLGTPILAIAPSGCDLEKILDNTGLSQRFAATDTSGITAFLSDAMRGDRSKTRTVDAYSWTNLAKIIDGVLRDIISNKTDCGHS